MKRFNSLIRVSPVTFIDLAAAVLVTLIVTLVSLVLVPGEFGARLYAFANVAVLGAGVWLAGRDLRRHWRD